MPLPGLPSNGLGMKVAITPGLPGDRLERVAERDQVVGCLERRRGVDVDLVLAAGDLVVGRVDGDAHAHQRADHALAEIAVAVAREVEVRAAVVAGRDERTVGPRSRRKNSTSGPTRYSKPRRSASSIARRSTPAGRPGRAHRQGSSPSRSGARCARRPRAAAGMSTGRGRGTCRTRPSGRRSPPTSRRTRFRARSPRRAGTRGS